MGYHGRDVLAEFVNRETEMERFRGMLQDPEAHAFVVWGPGGVGKTSLRTKMMDEVTRLELASLEVTWTDTRNHDLMAITRTIRDALGATFFSGFNQLLEYFAVSRHEVKMSLEGQANISVAQDASFHDSQVSKMAGIMVNIEEPWRDPQTSENERRARLTDAFLEGAAAALADRSAVIFFDATEKMASETERWVWGELLPAACDGRMGRAKFVLCGRSEPQVDRWLKKAIRIAQLKPLTRDYIHAYLLLRGVPENECGALSRMLALSTKGNLRDLADLVDSYLLDDESAAA